MAQAVGISINTEAFGTGEPGGQVGRGAPTFYVIRESLCQARRDNEGFFLVPEILMNKGVIHSEGRRRWPTQEAASQATSTPRHQNGVFCESASASTHALTP